MPSCFIDLRRRPAWAQCTLKVPPAGSEASPQLLRDWQQSFGPHLRPVRISGSQLFQPQSSTRCATTTIFQRSPVWASKSQAGRGGNVQLLSPASIRMRRCCSSSHQAEADVGAAYANVQRLLLADRSDAGTLPVQKWPSHDFLLRAIGLGVHSTAAA